MLTRVSYFIILILLLSSCHENKVANKNNRDNLNKIFKFNIDHKLAAGYTTVGKFSLLENESLANPVQVQIFIPSFKATVKTDHCEISNTNRSCDIAVTSKMFVPLHDLVNVEVNIVGSNIVYSETIEIVDKSSLVIEPLAFNAIPIAQTSTFQIKISGLNGDVKPSSSNILLESVDYYIDVDSYNCNAIQDFIICNIKVKTSIFDIGRQFRIHVIAQDIINREYSEGYSDYINVISYHLTSKNFPQDLQKKTTYLATMEIDSLGSDVILAEPIRINAISDNENIATVTPNYCDFDATTNECLIKLITLDTKGIVRFSFGSDETWSVYKYEIID